MIVWAREKEIDLESVRKRKPVQVQVSEGSRKKPKVVDLRLKGQKGRGRYGKTSYFIRDCTATTIQGSGLSCFHCNKMGHKKDGCLSLVAKEVVVAPAPATLRIIDGRQARWRHR